MLLVLTMCLHLTAVHLVSQTHLHPCLPLGYSHASARLLQLDYCHACRSPPHLRVIPRVPQVKLDDNVSKRMAASLSNPSAPAGASESSDAVDFEGSFGRK